MIQNPPCFNPLVGCGDDGQLLNLSGVGQSGLFGTRPTASPQSISAETGIDFSLLSDRLKEYASGSVLRRHPKQYFAEYVIRVKNVSGKLLQGVTIDHGPLPFGAIFQSQKSDPRCALVSKMVRCTTTLRSGETQDLTVTYETTSSFTCQFARILERVKVAYGVLRSGDVPQVLTTVECTTRSIPRDGSLFDGQNGEADGVGASTSDGQSIFVPKNDENTGIQPNVGYKPYEILPQTGGDTSLFVGSVQAQMLTPVPSVEPQSLSSLLHSFPLLLALASVAMMYTMRSIRFRS